MNEFVFAPSYRDLSRGCCMSITCLLIQFSFKSATETSECKAHVANSQWQRLPDRSGNNNTTIYNMSESLQGRLATSNANTWVANSYYIV